MTAASPGPNFFSVLSLESTDRARRESFAFSFLAQAAVLGLIVYFTSCFIGVPPTLISNVRNLEKLPLLFSGTNGGGGGNHELLPASRGTPPRASLAPQILAPTIRVSTEQPKLAAEETVMVAPEIKFPAGEIGNPLSKFAGWKSDGRGGPDGMGDGCCGGIGDWSGPGAGNGPPGIFPAGKGGVTVPQVIFNPEPSFSDEARESKTQGIVLLTLVVGKDGHPYDIRVGQSLGMGLDEKAIEAVNRWRFRAATLNGQPVATRIAVEVNFHLY